MPPRNGCGPNAALRSSLDDIFFAMTGNVESRAGNYALDRETLNRAVEITKRHVLVKRALRGAGYTISAALREVEGEKSCL